MIKNQTASLLILIFFLILISSALRKMPRHSLAALLLFTCCQGWSAERKEWVTLIAAADPTATRAGDKTMTTKIQKSVFGKMPDGTVVDLYTLTNTKGVVAKITPYGALVTELWVPDRNG